MTTTVSFHRRRVAQQCTVMNLFVLLFLLVSVPFLDSNNSMVDAFAVPSPSSTKTKTIVKKTPPPGPNELPKYDGKTQKWITTGSNQLKSAGYSPTKTLLLQGPKPFLTRIFQEDDYEQAVLKFMAGDKISNRDIAQGNMDAYLRNPQDWMYNRMEAQKRGTEMNYTNISTKDVVLVISWSIIVTAFIGRFVYSYVNGVGKFADL